MYKEAEKKNRNSFSLNSVEFYRLEYCSVLYLTSGRRAGPIRRGGDGDGGTRNKENPEDRASGAHEL